MSNYPVAPSYTNASTFVSNYDTAYGLYTGVATDGNAWMQVGRNDGAIYYNIILQPNGGNLLIGKTSQANSSYKLDINGSARANEVFVNSTGADFVFDKKYSLPKLSEVKTYIDQNHHLPEIPSAEAMKVNGLELGQMNTKLLQKVEELTLYLIGKDKQLTDQQSKIDEQEIRISALEKALLKLISHQSK